MERRMRMRKGEFISKKVILSGAKKEWRGKRRTFQDRESHCREQQVKLALPPY